LLLVLSAPDLAAAHALPAQDPEGKSEALAKYTAAAFAAERGA
jgi:hypothetical protein